MEVFSQRTRCYGSINHMCSIVVCLHTCGLFVCTYVNLRTIFTGLTLCALFIFIIIVILFLLHIYYHLTVIIILIFVIIITTIINNSYTAPFLIILNLLNFSSIYYRSGTFLCLTYLKHDKR